MDETAERILDATVAEAAASGLDRVSMERVARRAGVNRATVYRHFRDREGLIAAMAARDTQRGMEVVTTAVGGATDPTEGLLEGVVALLRWVRAHPFITRAAREEPGWLIAAGMSDDAAMLRQAVTFGATLIREWYDGPADPEQLAETIARLLASYVLLPVTVSVDLDDDAGVRAYVRTVIAPLITADSAAPAS